jgi:hypothetical protein
MEHTREILNSLLVLVLGLIIEYFIFQPLKRFFDEAKSKGFSINTLFSEVVKKIRALFIQNQIEAKRKSKIIPEFIIRWLVSTISVFVFFVFYYWWLFPYLMAKYSFNYDISLPESFLFPPWINFAVPVVIILLGYLFGFIVKQVKTAKARQSSSFLQFYYYLIGVAGMELVVIGVITGLVNNWISGLFLIVVGFFIFFPAMMTYRRFSKI